MKANIFKIKKEKLDVWKKWCQLLNSDLKMEAIETLIEEKVSYEAFAIFKIKEEFYTIGFGEGEFLPANLNKEINIKHQAVKKECLEYIDSAEMLYELIVKNNFNDH